MPDPSRSRFADGYRWLFKGRNTSLRRTSVYQISKYPSRQKRIEKALRSHPGGINTSNAFGKEILHPGGGGAIVVGTSLATITSRRSSSAKVGSLASVGFLSKINERTGSMRGSLCTCSSDRSRYRPASKSRSQTRSRSVPWSHDTQSDNSLGTVMRLYVSAVTWAGLISGVISLNFTDFYRDWPVLTLSFSTGTLLPLLTFTDFYHTLAIPWVGLKERWYR